MNVNILSISIGLVAIIVSAYCTYSVPYVSDVPFTFQSLIVFIVAARLKTLDFLVCILIYLLLGIFGLPVFAEGSSGFDKLLGSSGGFLYGFAFSGYYISSYFKDGANTGFIAILNVMIQATVILFFFGLIHLTFLHGLNNALNYGLYPFWSAALLKIFVASVVVYLLIRYQRS